MSVEQVQLEHLHLLLERVRTLSGFNYSDEFLSVSLAEIEGALAEGERDWQSQQEVSDVRAADRGADGPSPATSG